jgi:hypothetical protein
MESRLIFGVAPSRRYGKNLKYAKQPGQRNLSMPAALTSAHFRKKARTGMLGRLAKRSLHDEAITDRCPAADERNALAAHRLW